MVDVNKPQIKREFCPVAILLIFQILRIVHDTMFHKRGPNRSRYCIVGDNLIAAAAHFDFVAFLNIRNILHDSM